MNRTFHLAALVALLASSPAAAQDPFQPRPDEVMVGPFPVEQTVQGVPLSTQVYGYFLIRPVDDRLQINARAVADVSDLQNKIGALVDTIPLPTDNCEHFGPDNLVARILGKQITISGNVATLKLNGEIENWLCQKNVPCSKLEGFRIVFWDCRPPIKTSVTSSFEATLPFTLTVADPHTIAVQLGQPTVDLKGLLGGVLNGVLRIAGVDINSRAREALSRAVNPDLLKQTVPKDLLWLNPVVTRAELSSHSGALTASLEMTAALDGEALGELIDALLTRPHDKE